MHNLRNLRKLVDSNKCNKPKWSVQFSVLVEEWRLRSMLNWKRWKSWAWKNYPVKFHDARLSNLSRREDSRHIFISSPRCGGGATRKRVSALRESERERERRRGRADTRFNRRYTDDNNGENSRYSVNRKGEGEKRQEGEEKERDRRGGGRKRRRRRRIEEGGGWVGWVCVE